MGRCGLVQQCLSEDFANLRSESALHVGNNMFKQTLIGNVDPILEVVLARPTHAQYSSYLGVVEELFHVNVSIDNLAST